MAEKKKATMTCDACLPQFSVDKVVNDANQLKNQAANETID